MRAERIRTFYEENSRGLYTYALSLTQDAELAEDLVHTIVCKLLQRPFLPYALKPYAYRCIRNMVIDHWRSQEVRRVDIKETKIAERFQGISTASLSRAELEQLLGRLEADDREIIILKSQIGLTFKEIARVQNISLNTAAARYRRALEKLKRMFGEEAYEENRGTIGSTTADCGARTS